MIARTSRGRVPAQKGDAYYAYIERTGPRRCSGRMMRPFYVRRN